MRGGGAGDGPLDTRAAGKTGRTSAVGADSGVAGAGSGGHGSGLGSLVSSGGVASDDSTGCGSGGDARTETAASTEAFSAASCCSCEILSRASSTWSAVTRALSCSASRTARPERTKAAMGKTKTMATRPRTSRTAKASIGEDQECEGEILLVSVASLDRMKNGSSAPGAFIPEVSNHFPRVVSITLDREQGGGT